MKKLVICLIMLFAPMALANIHVPTLSPTFDSNDYLKTLSARTLLQNQWYFGVVSNFEHRPLKFNYDKINFSALSDLMIQCWLNHDSLNVQTFSLPTSNNHEIAGVVYDEFSSTYY